MRVLVIDDEAVIRAIFREFLDMLGHEVDMAASGDEGLALLGRHQYDLVLTDLFMPGMSGLEVAGTIRARWPRIPVIIASGYAGDHDQHRIEAAGFPFLQKPIGIDEFNDAVNAAFSPPSDMNPGNNALAPGRS
jgi:CheY-like chemotaxis protein